MRCSSGMGKADDQSWVPSTSSKGASYSSDGRECKVSSSSSSATVGPTKQCQTGDTTKTIQSRRVRFDESHSGPSADPCDIVSEGINLHEHQQRHQAGVATDADRPRRDATSSVVQGRASTPPPGARARTCQSQEARGERTRTSGVGQEDQPGERQEDEPGDSVRERAGPGAERERDDCPAGAQGHGAGTPPGQGGSPGLRGFRQARGAPVPGHPPLPQGVPRLGHQDGGGEPIGMRSPSEPVGPVALREPRVRGEDGDRGDPREVQAREASGTASEESRRDAQGEDGTIYAINKRARKRLLITGAGHGTTCRCDHTDGRRDPELAGGDAGPAGGAPAEEGWSQSRPQVGHHVGGLHEDWERVDPEVREPAHPEYEAQGAQLSAGRASQLEHESQLLIPGLFQALVGFGRPVLMEVACDSDSVLSRVIQEEVGCEGAALRASLWNGADLSTSAGVRMVLERIGLENPSTVWLSPPCGPFSPMQHTNARTPEQSEELKRKRDQAKRIYAGAAIVFRYCVQHGIHCAWEMSEKSDAWRLPVLQNLLRKFPLHVSVAHGCRVGLRDKTGKQLLRKGWKIVTTHAQLAASLQLLCKCPKSYNHGRCEGEATNRSAKYTPEFGRRVSKALLHELGSRGVQQECQGHSQLGEQFGEGLTCQCEDLPRDAPEKCGTCLFRDGLVPPKQASGISGNPRPQASQEETGPDFGGPEPLEEANYNRDEVQQAEELAKALEQNKDYRDSACEELLRQLPLQPHLSRKGQLGETRVNYFVFGAYAYGSQYGVAQRTRVLPHCVKYINHYLKHKDPNQRKWTSFVVNYNQAMPIHRDVNNQAQQPNLLIGLGNYTKGGVWVQETTQARDMGLQPGKMGAVCSRVTPLGETVWGRVWETRGKLVEFPPKAWHGTEPWVGERIALSAYTIRGQGQLQPEELQQLRKVGFPLPPQPTKQPWEAYPAQVTEGEKKREEERLKRQLYLLHAATGHCSTKHLLEALKT